MASEFVKDPYPTAPRDRDRWILTQRGSRFPSDPQKPVGHFVEAERSDSSEIVDVATIFLANRECPWRCVMCDLWKHTLAHSVPAGAIPAQIEFALHRLPPARHIKLYNAGSFFDPGAIPSADHSAITDQIRDFERVIVECHPALVDDRIPRFRDRLSGKLEVAIGLETAHPEALEKLNKRMTLDQFRVAAAFLRLHEIDIRVFLLSPPPFIPSSEIEVWMRRSIDVAFDCGATVVTLIPTRVGNGALDTLRAQGLLAPSTIAQLERSQDYGIAQGRGRVFADVWDLALLSDCPNCFPARVQRLRAMNLSQQPMPAVECCVCRPASSRPQERIAPDASGF